jgi:hypothetical protein
MFNRNLSSAGAGALAATTGTVGTPNGFTLTLVTARRTDPLLQLRLKLNADPKIGNTSTIESRMVNLCMANS